MDFTSEDLWKNPVESIRECSYLDDRNFFNDSVTSCRIPSVWKSSIVIPIPKLGKDSSLLIGLSRSESYGCSLTLHRQQLPASIRMQTNTVSITSALLQLTSDIASGFNQRKPPHRTVCDIRSSRPQRIVIKDGKINTAGGDLSMAVKLH